MLRCNGEVLKIAMQAPQVSRETRQPNSACWPLGLETLAAPMLRAGYTLPTGGAALNASMDPADVLFRYIDGGWTDGANAAFTLARMQARP